MSATPESAAQSGSGTLVDQPDAALGGPLQPAFDMLELGGPVVAIIAVLSVCALAIIIRKLFQILPLGSRRSARVSRAVEIWRHGDHATALTDAERLKGPTASVVAASMRLSMQNMRPALLREEVERRAGEQLHRLRSSLRGLEAIAQVTPLLGLFGTILGMIAAFQTLQDAGAQVDPAMLAGGIWVALLTTAAGLAVSIPCNLILHWFEGRIDGERQAMENLATLVLTSAGHDEAIDAAERPERAQVLSPLPKAAHAR